MQAVFLYERLGMTRCTTPSALEDVVQHLQRLLNTRQGEALACPDYGLVDLVDLLSALPQSADDIGRSIEASIRRFEPRLMVHQVTLRRDPSHWLLQFSIEASLVVAPRRAHRSDVLRLSAQVDAQGRIEIGA